MERYKRTPTKQRTMPMHSAHIPITMMGIQNFHFASTWKFCTGCWNYHGAVGVLSLVGGHVDVLRKRPSKIPAQPVEKCWCSWWCSWGCSWGCSWWCSWKCSAKDVVFPLLLLLHWSVPIHLKLRKWKLNVSKFKCDFNTKSKSEYRFSAHFRYMTPNGAPRPRPERSKGAHRTMSLLGSIDR